MDDSMNKVAVLIEDLMSQFRVFGEGQQNLIDTVADVKNDLETIKADLVDLKIENRLEHKDINQKIDTLTTNQQEIKKKVNDLDQEFEIKLRRVK